MHHGMLVMNVTCICLPLYIFISCACFAGTINLGKKDIVFLVDGSDTTGGTGIAHIRDFILSVVQQLDVQPDQVRVAVVQYSDNVKTEFSLNSHNNKQAVISAVKRLRQMGGQSSDLGDALKYVTENELRPSSGSRPSDASQHLVVVTGGRSPQDVSIYGPLLKGSRVNCIGVGAGGTNTRQLIQIATTPDDVLQVPTFPGLPAIRERFITRLSGTIPELPSPDYEQPSKKCTIQTPICLYLCIILAWLTSSLLYIFSSLIRITFPAMFNYNSLLG